MNNGTNEHIEQMIILYVHSDRIMFYYYEITMIEWMKWNHEFNDDMIDDIIVVLVVVIINLVVI